MSAVLEPVVNRERDRRLARVVIGPGVRRNALTSGAWAGIERAARRLADDDDVRVVIVEGASGWFCAGSDIREWAAATPAQVELSFARMEAACRAIEDLPVPTIAKIRGPAAGAGCQLAMACDLRFLAEGASIGMPIAVLGILVSPAFANRLAARCGVAGAAELLFTGRMVDADQAVRLALANACVPTDDLDTHVEAVVTEILDSPAASIRAAKRAVTGLLHAGRSASQSAVGPATDDAAFRQGVAAFLHRRRARAVRART